MKMDFSEALFLLKAGKRVRCESWTQPMAFIRLIDVDHDGRRSIAMRFENGQEIDLTPTLKMILADDWQEVEGEET